MKIGIDIRPTLKRKTGIGKYTFNLIKAIAGVDAGNQYLLYSRKKILDFKRHLPELPGENFSHYVDYFKKGPGRILPDVDVFHTSSYDLEKPKKAKFIITIHDVIIKAYPHAHTEGTIREGDEKLRRVLGEADILVADSHNTRSDLIKFYGVDEERIQVIYPGVNISHERRGATCNEEYILFVGTLEPRKNVDGLIKAFDCLKKEHNAKHKLYIVGMKGWMFEDVFKAYEEADFKKDIIFKGYVGDDELADLYQNALVFTYPSFYEGFGFPIVEAFSHGIPVVTSKTSSCGEIAGDSALLVEPSDYREIGDAIYKLINDQALREIFREKGLKRAKGFSWDRTAKEFLRLFVQ